VKIALACPRCDGELSERFSAKECILVLGGSYSLEMECLTCGASHNVKLITREQKAGQIILSFTVNVE
jgi:uncharacterized Zn finger protein